MKHFACIIAFVGFLGTYPAAAETFEYVDPIDSRVNISIQTSPPTVAFGDIGFSGRLCSKDDRFICVSSEPFFFAVPRRLDSQSRRWEHEGVVYSVIGRKPFDLLGVRSEALQIQSVQGSRKYVFVYSARRGLLAIEGTTPDARRVFVSNKDIGFGAPSRR